MTNRQTKTFWSLTATDALRRSGFNLNQTPGVNIQMSKAASQRLCRLGNLTLALTLSAISLSAQTGKPPTESKGTPPARRTAAVTKRYTPASIQALPGLQCKLYPQGGAPASGLDVFTDDDGFARFHAVRPEAGDAVQQLVLDCKNSAGNNSNFTVDLSAEATFVPRPVNLASERGSDRPALRGDPLSYSHSALIQAGYGLRPDPADTAAYSRWLASASKAGRRLEAKRPTSTSHGVYTEQSNPWTGSVLTGATKYISTEAVFNVPVGIPGGDETTETEISIWNGLGGFHSNSGLIQGGVYVKTTPTVASYGSWREYCCGDDDSNVRNDVWYGGTFTPNPGDVIYSIEWYCDAAGNANLNGGYGCTFLHDLTSGAILDCTSATGSPCWSAKALPQCSASPTTLNCMTLGMSAEFVLENQTPQVSSQSTAFTDFAPQVTITGSAHSATSKSQTVNDDPVVHLLTDFTDTTSHLNVSLGKTGETNFSVSQFAPVGGKSAGSIIQCLGNTRYCNSQPIAVGPNAYGSTVGDGWVLGADANASGDYGIYRWMNSTWVPQTGAATQIAVSPQGIPWIINHTGRIFYWNGSAYQEAPGNGCAVSIGVGPSLYTTTPGGPWVIGCDGGFTKNGSIYQLQGSTWVRQPGSGTEIAVSPQGIPWVITAEGAIYYWDYTRRNWVKAPNGCATSIAVGPNTAPLAGPHGDVWITGCGVPSDQGFSIFQLQGEKEWVPIPGVASRISVSPDKGVPWAVTFRGEILK
jgi:hypothetical protein